MASETLSPVALTIAGSDSSGGAGIQADMKTFVVFGCYGATALTAVTAQNTCGVRSAMPLDPDLITEQIDAVAEDFPVAAAKTGMLGTAEAIAAVARAVERHRLAPLVVDPVMVAKSGDPLIDDAAVDVLRERLLPLGTVTTPNRYEAARLLEMDDAAQNLANVEAAAEAARMICNRYGTAACVVKGIPRGEGAAGEAAESVDVCCDGREVHEITGPHHADGAVHGSGCAYSAAIAAGLAHGQPLHEALQTAKRFIDGAIARGPRIGGGTPPVDPTTWTVQLA